MQPVVLVVGLIRNNIWCMRARESLWLVYVYMCVCVYMDVHRNSSKQNQKKTKTECVVEWIHGLAKERDTTSSKALRQLTGPDSFGSVATPRAKRFDANGTVYIGHRVA